MQSTVAMLQERLAEAEARLWESSLENSDALLPPALLRAAMRQARTERCDEKRSLGDQHRRDISYLQGPAPPASTRSGQSPRHPVVHRPLSASVGTGADFGGLPAVPPKSARATVRRPLPSARRPGAPTNRTDVLAVEEMLDRRLRSDGETVLAFDAAFESIIEQVQSHCTERGELLARVREWLLQHVWWLESQLRTAQQQAHRASEQRETAVTELESLRVALGDDADGHKRASMGPGGGRKRSSSMRRTVAAAKPDGIGIGLPSASGAAGDDDLQRVLGVERDKGHLTDDAVLAHFGELSSSDCSSLLDDLVTQVGAQWDSSVLTRMVASCLAHLPADELTDLMRAAVLDSSSGRTDNRRRLAMGTAMDALHSASASEAREVLIASVATWPPSEIIDFVCELHKSLSDASRVQLITTLEPQLGDDECEFLAAACAHEKVLAHRATQTEEEQLGVSGDWRRVLDSFLKLEEGARLNMLQMLGSQGSLSAHEIALCAKIGGEARLEAKADRRKVHGGGDRSSNGNSGGEISSKGKSAGDADDDEEEGEEEAAHLLKRSHAAPSASSKAGVWGSSLDWNQLGNGSIKSPLAPRAIGVSRASKTSKDATGEPMEVPAPNFAPVSNAGAQGES